MKRVLGRRIRKKTSAAEIVGRTAGWRQPPIALAMLGATLVAAPFASVPAAKAAPSTPPSVDPAQVVVVNDRISNVTPGTTVSFTNAIARVAPAGVSPGSNDTTSVISLARDVPLDRLQVRVSGPGYDATVGLTAPIPATRRETTLVHRLGQTRDVTPMDLVPINGASAVVPPNAPAGSTAVLEFQGGGVAKVCAGCVTSYALDASSNVAAELARRDTQHASDFLLGSWAALDTIDSRGELRHFSPNVGPSELDTAGASTVLRVVRAWQSQSAAANVIIEQFWSTSGTGQVTELALGTTSLDGWTVDDELYPGHGNDKKLTWTQELPPTGWNSAFVKRQSGSLCMDCPSVVADLSVGGAALPSVTGYGTAVRLTPGTGVFVGEAAPALLDPSMPSDVQSAAKTQRIDSEFTTDVGQSLVANPAPSSSLTIAANTKNHDCTYDPQGRPAGQAKDLYVDCYQYQEGTNAGYSATDNYWVELHTKPENDLGFWAGTKATSKCWIWSVHTNSHATQPTSHSISCRFHNSEHGDESMGAQVVTTSQNSLGTWYKQSERVPNDGWKTYKFWSCCSLGLNPFSVSPAQFQSVWWASSRASTTDAHWPAYLTTSCVYTKIQPSRSTGEGGFCDYSTGTQP